MAFRRNALTVVAKLAVYLSFMLSIFLLSALVFGSMNLVPSQISKSDLVEYSVAEKLVSEEPPELTIYDKMQPILNCYEKNYVFEREQKGDYWVLRNYIQAGHGKLKCHESITLTTNGDYSFLQFIPKLVDRWRAPISMALFTPGTDFMKTLEAIKYILKCDPLSDQIKEYVTFHMFFPLNHLPEEIPMSYEEFWALTDVDCSQAGPFEDLDVKSMYKNQNKLLYPINFARNLARLAAQTHFVFSNDVELFPSPNLVEEFFKMVVRDPSVLTGKDPRVFVIAPFEVKEDQELPNNKTQLLAMIKAKKAQPFHKRLCRTCHAFPKQKEWLNTTETTEMNVFSCTKRMKDYKYWEPFYIGTNKEPTFDERVSWEGQSNKRIQNFPMCLLNYDYMVLNNAFLVHNPGIKTKAGVDDPVRRKYIKLTDILIQKVIVPELKIMYGNRKGCVV